MADNFVQVSSGSGNTTAAATLLGVVAGNTIVACFGNGSSASPVALSVADPVNGAYTARGARASDGTNNVVAQFFTLSNANSGTHVITGTTDATNGCDIVVFEIGSTAGASSFSGANQAFQSAPGTGTDGLSSGSVTVSGTSTLLGISFDSSSTNTADEPATGTGFTSRANALSANCGVYRAETKSAAANAATTFTAITGSQNFLTFGIAILNASGGASFSPGWATGATKTIGGVF